jgi:hypothetical protein
MKGCDCRIPQEWIEMTAKLDEELAAQSRAAHQELVTPQEPAMQQEISIQHSEDPTTQPLTAAFYNMTPEGGEEFVRLLKEGQQAQLAVPDEYPDWNPFITFSPSIGERLKNKLVTTIQTD